MAATIFAQQKKRITMKTIQYFLTAAFMFALTFNVTLADDTAKQPAKQAPNELRVLCYNIHVCIGNDGKLDLERTAKVIKAQNPDIVALQEVDNKADRTKNVDQTAELTKLTGMHAAFGKTIDIAGGEYGIAILSKYPILGYQMVQLPRQEKQEDRGALSAIIDLGEGKKLTFVCTHFCHVSEERRTKQAEKINEWFADLDGPVIVAGDFNAKPDSKTIETMKSKWADATNDKPTFSSDRPRSKIDYIFYRPAETFRVKETRVIEEPVASDHSPILAVLEFVD